MRFPRYKASLKEKLARLQSKLGEALNGGESHFMWSGRPPGHHCPGLTGSIGTGQGTAARGMGVLPLEKERRD